MEDKPIQIKNLIYQLRGKAVMLDRDLALLYQIETRKLNQAVKRNFKRFPKDFMFSLSRPEILSISQIVTSFKYSKNVNAFTEQGVAMLSSVLKSDVAVEVNIQIMRTFVKMRRHFLTSVDLKRKIDGMEQKYDSQFRVVFDALRQLIEPQSKPTKKKPGMGFTGE